MAKDHARPHHAALQPMVRELEEAYGIEKSTVSEHFIEASRGRLQKLTGQAAASEHMLVRHDDRRNLF